MAKHGDVLKLLNIYYSPFLSKKGILKMLTSVGPWGMAGWIILKQFIYDILYFPGVMPVIFDFLLSPKWPTGGHFPK